MKPSESERAGGDAKNQDSIPTGANATAGTAPARASAKPSRPPGAASSGPGGAPSRTTSGPSSGPSPDQSGPSGLPRASWIRRRLVDGNRVHQGAIIALIVCLLALFIWHLVKVNQLEDRVVKEREALYDSVLAAEIRSSLRATGHTLGWAAAETLARGDVAAIDERITSIVKEVGPVLYIAIVDAEGTVLVATNKKLEGKPARSIFPGFKLDAADIEILDSGTPETPIPPATGSAVEMMVVVPFGPREERLGTAILAYSRPLAPSAGE